MENNNNMGNHNNYYFSSDYAAPPFNTPTPIYHKLHKKAFMLLTAGIAIAVGMMIANHAINFSYNISEFIAEYAYLEGIYRMRALTSFIFNTIIFTAGALAGGLVYYGIMTKMVLRHKRTERKGIYLIVMMVFSIVLTVGISLFILIDLARDIYYIIDYMETNPDFSVNPWWIVGNLIALIQIASQIIILVGIKKHRRAVKNGLPLDVGERVIEEY